MRQIAEMPEYNTDDFTVQLANGEFCANKHCDDMLDILLDTKWKVVLLSNLSLYKDKLAILMDNGRVSKLTTSLDAGTRETFKTVKRVDAFDKVVDNFKKYPVDKTKFLVKYIFLKNVNDNEADVNGYYDIVKETGGIVMPTSNLNAPYTDKMRELTLRLVQRAKADGVKVDAGSSYLSPKDARFIAESYASA
jgi:molybdenum cofactor biosynthesis enzyme MoaA